MLWIGALLALVAGIGMVLVVVRTKHHHTGVDDLGAVSDHWIATHRVDLP